MTEPTPEQMTREQYNQAINDASRAYIAVVRTYPRDPARIAAARAAIDDLIRTRDELYG